MKRQWLVVLFGDSLLMDTVEASLGDNPELGVVRIHSTVTDVEEHLKSLHPDVIIFDFDAPHTQFILPFLRDQPDVPLLGLDVTCSRVVALSSQHYTALTMNDLIQVIQAQNSLEAGNGKNGHVALGKTATELLQWLVIPGRPPESSN